MVQKKRTSSLENTIAPSRQEENIMVFKKKKKLSIIKYDNYYINKRIIKTIQKKKWIIKKCINNGELLIRITKHLNKSSSMKKEDFEKMISRPKLHMNWTISIFFSRNVIKCWDKHTNTSRERREGGEGIQPYQCSK